MAITRRIGATPLSVSRVDKDKPRFPVYLTINGVEIQIGWTYGVSKNV